VKRLATPHRRRARWDVAEPQEARDAERPSGQKSSDEGPMVGFAAIVRGDGGWVSVDALLVHAIQHEGVEANGPDSCNCP
jgi:type IV secretory pathway VirJ component